MSAYRAAHLDSIAAEQWPYWAPIRHHFDIKTFGVNAWRGSDGDEVIKRHHETESGDPELYIVLSGRATFTSCRALVGSRPGPMADLPLLCPTSWLSTAACIGCTSIRTVAR